MLRVYRSRARDQDEAIAKLKRQLTEAEAKIQQQARDFDTYKNQLHTKPEVQLQSDVNLLTIEKVSSISLAHKCSVWYWIVYFPKLKCECSNFQNLIFASFNAREIEFVIRCSCISAIIFVLKFS